MKKLSIFITLLTIGLSALGQSSHLKQNYYLTFNAASFFSPYNRNIDLSIIATVAPRIRLELGLAPIIPGGNLSDGGLGREHGKGAIKK